MEQDKSRIFNEYCGEILRLGVDVSSALDFALANIFIHPQNERTFILQGFFSELEFEKKIQFFKKTCKFIGYDNDKLKEVIDYSDKIRNLRNRVAHQQSFIDKTEEGIKLRKNEIIMFEEDTLVLTEELMSEARDWTALAKKAITDIYLDVMRDKKLGLRAKKFQEGLDSISEKRKKNLLFVSNQGVNRSKTAAEIYSDGYHSDYCGIYSEERPLIKKLLEWANIVIVMEESQREFIAKNFPKQCLKNKIITLNIPDNYSYGQEELVNLIKGKIEEVRI